MYQAVEFSPSCNQIAPIKQEASNRSTNAKIAPTDSNANIVPTDTQVDLDASSKAKNISDHSTNINTTPVPEQTGQIVIGTSTEATNVSTNTTVALISNDTATKPAKKLKRKKKISFGVMSVIGAEKQNSRAVPGTTQDKLIQTNDIILKINESSILSQLLQP